MRFFDFNLYHTYHLDLIDELYSQWSEDPNAVEAMEILFEGYQTGKSNKIIVNQSASHNPDHIKQARFAGLIYAYRAITIQ